ncbi:Uncharacterised protein [Acinetobacter baumannii]|nr:Uncharacterised protein [Acinetobacter baumannii]
MIALERRGHRDQKRIGRLRFGHRPQITALNGVLDHFIQIRFDDVDRATVNGIYRMLVYINAHHFFLA